MLTCFIERICALAPVPDVNPIIKSAVESASFKSNNTVEAGVNPIPTLPTVSIRIEPTVKSPVELVIKLLLPSWYPQLVGINRDLNLEL